ncbi:carboxypeptidase-like regulatory domain-containing protein [bacterium]|nr:carboxypeptidase-like regulatory domain-containing protein [bacterium]
MNRGFISLWVKAFVLFSFVTAAVVNGETAVATGALTGVVMDAVTSAPLAGARIVASRTPNSTETLTNSYGVYQFDRLTSGSNHIMVYKIGYAPMLCRANVVDGASTRYDIAVTPDTTDYPRGNLAGVVKAWQTGQLFPGQRIYYEDVFALSGYSFVVSDAQARFRIDNLREKPSIRLWTTVAGYMTSLVEPPVVADKTTSVTILLYPPGEYNYVRVYVNNRVGDAAIPGARIYYRMIGSSSEWYGGATNSNGSFCFSDKLMAGTYDMRIEHDAFASETIRATVVPSIAEIEVWVTMQPLEPTEGSIAGRALDAATSASIAGVKVLAVSTNPARTTQTLTNKFGEFRFDRLAAGSAWSLVFSKTGYNNESSACTVPAAGTVQRDVAMSGIGSLYGGVESTSTGRPLAGVLLKLTPAAASSSWPFGVSRYAVTDSDGAYRFPAVPSGLYSACAAKPGYVEQSKPIAVAVAGTRLDFLLQPAAAVQYGKLAGKVVDAVTSAPLPVAWVMVQLELSESLAAAPRRLVTATNALGAYKLDRVPVGSWTVSAARRGYLPTTHTAVIVKDQQTNLNLGLQPIVNKGAIVGTVTDEASGAALPNIRVIVPLIDQPHMANFNSALNGVTDSGGHYKIAGVPAGPRHVTAFGAICIPQTRPVTVVANTTATLDFALVKRPVQTLRVGVFDSLTGKPLPGARVSVPVCDIVEPFADWDMFQAAASGSGVATLGGIPDGTFPVVGSAPNYQTGFVPIPPYGVGSTALFLTPDPGRNTATNWMIYR